MVNKKYFAFIFFLFIFCAFSFFSSKPDWIDGSSEKYPEKSFLIGVGVAKNLDDARTLARAEISKIFQVQVSQSATSSESERTTKSEKSGQPSTSSDLKSAQETKTLTEMALVGVSIPETWNDEKNKTYYALAVLDKTKTRVSLANKISEEEEKIQAQLEIADEASLAIEEIKALTSAIASWDIKTALFAQKRIVDPIASEDLPIGTTRTEIVNRKENALKKIIFIVQQKENQEASNIHEILKERITKAGFKVDSSIPENKDTSITYIIIKYSVNIQPIDRGDPKWKFFGWNGTIEIAEAKSANSILASISKDGQESHIVENTAKSKAVSAAGESLAQATGEWIQNYIFGK
ncbi:LPP20 family lipoprotein [Candidatus Poribacteria bacterium]|nr:LPP20 family lipoprotein [Candidatus Poribacteria bacterium]